MRGATIAESNGKGVGNGYNSRAISAKAASDKGSQVTEDHVPIAVPGGSENKSKMASYVFKSCYFEFLGVHSLTHRLTPEELTEEGYKDLTGTTLIVAGNNDGDLSRYAVEDVFQLPSVVGVNRKMMSAVQEKTKKQIIGQACIVLYWTDHQTTKKGETPLAVNELLKYYTYGQRHEKNGVSVTEQSKTVT